MGTAAAHAVRNKLTVLSVCHHMKHGKKVNFGTLTQLVLKNVYEDEHVGVLNWMTTAGLPSPSVHSESHIRARSTSCPQQRLYALPKR